MANLIHPRLLVSNALSQAMRLAESNPQQPIAIFRKKTGPDPGAWRLYVRPASDPAPQGADLLTLVRHGAAQPQSRCSLSGALQDLMEQLPQGVTLSRSAAVESYPPERATFGQPKAAVFAYQFLTSEGRNIATWIPDAAAHGVTVHAGSDGRGREFSPDASQVTHDIGEFIDFGAQAAQVSAEIQRRHAHP